MKKVNIKYLVCFIILIIILFMIKSLCFNYKDYSKDYFYMDTYINVKISSNSKTKANKALTEIDNIYKTYHELTDRYNSNPNGLYDLNNGKTKIDYRLYKMIEYADSWYDQTNGLLDISIGNVVDIWKKYRESGTGVPSLEELKSVNISHDDVNITKDLTLADDMDGYIIDSPVTLNNNVTIDLGAISKGYTTELVGDYLKSIGISKYVINAGGNVLVGKKGNNEQYSIGIEDPTDTSKIYKVIKGNNIAVVTSGGYQRNYTYNGVTYNHIINPMTLYPVNNMQSVTVIDKSSKEADALSTTLFLMTVEDGQEFIKNYDAEAIWYLNDGTILTTEGFNKYE